VSRISLFAKDFLAAVPTIDYVVEVAVSQTTGNSWHAVFL
jgi:hypothetical protein